MKNGYYLEILTPKTMKIIGSTESKISKIIMVKMYLI